MSEIVKNNIPVHVSIIMDGNGRWAKARGKERIYGHVEGVESVRSCTEACLEAGVKYLSLYAFSEENWGRPGSEVSGLMELMMTSMEKEFGIFMEKEVQFRVLGNRKRLSAEMNEAIDRMEEATSRNGALTFILFLSYSGRWDILQAVRRMRDEQAPVEDFEKYLVTAGIPDPDLMIRTSGEKRLSNYLLWQSAYTEFLVVDTLWPDFRKPQFFAALEEFARRDRRYGKVK